MKARKALAKRIIKVLQPQLEAAVRAEADISNKPIDPLLKELEMFLDASLQVQQDHVSGSVGEADAAEDVEMADTTQAQQNGVEHTSEVDALQQQIETTDRNEGEDEDVEMQDEDAPHDLDDEDTVAIVVSGGSEVADNTVVAAPLAEVNGNTSPVKPHINGVKNESTPPDTNGYVTAPDTQQPAPPTPPVSNGGHATDYVDLNTGGILWYVKDYQPEGTSIVDPGASRLSEDLSDIDDEELRALGGDVDEAEGKVSAAVGTASASKAKKGKAKKRAKAHRW